MFMGMYITKIMCKEMIINSIGTKEICEKYFEKVDSTQL